MLDRAQFEAEIAQAHAEKYPDGCGGGLCMACVKRLGLSVATCPCCGNKSVPVHHGKLVPHDRMVGGRRFYRARPQACDGSGMAVRS